MKPLKLNLSKFKTVSQDANTTRLQHPDGHIIEVSHNALSPELRKQVQSLKVFAEGGEVDAIGKENYTGEKNDKKKNKVKYLNQGTPDLPDAEESMSGGAAPDSSDTQDTETAPIMPAPATPPQAQATPDSIVQASAPPTAPSTPAPTTPTQAASLSLDAQNIPSIGDPNAVSDYDVAIQNQSDAIKQQAKAQANLGNAEAGHLAGQIAVQKKLVNDYNEKNNTIDQQVEGATKDYVNSHIKPDRIFQNMSTFDRIRTAFGLILGGMGSGGGENQALKFLNSQIDRDVEAQKAELGKKENILAFAYKKYGNLRDATEFTKLLQTNIIANQLQMDIAKSQDPMAQANGLQALGQLRAQVAPIRFQMAMRQALMNNPQAAQLDPSKFIEFVVPEKHQPAAFKELQEAQQLSNANKNLIQAWHEADKINDPMNRMINPIQSHKQLTAIVDPLVAGLSKQTAGRYTEQDAAALRPLFPAFGDNDETKRIKLERFTQLINEKMNGPGAFPVLQGNKIPVQSMVGAPGQSVAVAPSGVALSHQQQRIVQWAKENPSNPKAQMVLKKLGYTP